MALSSSESRDALLAPSAGHRGSTVVRRRTHAHARALASCACAHARVQRPPGGLTATEARLGRQVGADERDENVRRAVVRELLAAESYQSGDLSSDWALYWRNGHPVASVVTAHPLHPMRSGARALVLLTGLCVCFFSPRPPTSSRAKTSASRTAARVRARGAAPALAGVRALV